MKKLLTLLVIIGILFSAFGVGYAIYHEISRPFVIIFVLLSWALMFWEMKKAPMEKMSE